MTVVEAYVGGKKMDPPDSSSQLHGSVSSLLFEGIAHNTQGNVYTPKVCLLLSFFLLNSCNSWISFHRTKYICFLTLYRTVERLKLLDPQPKKPFFLGLLRYLAVLYIDTMYFLNICFWAFVQRECTFVAAGHEVRQN